MSTERPKWEADHEDVVSDYDRVKLKFKTRGLIPWQPGHEKTPGSGRPRTKILTKAYRDILNRLDPSDPAARTFAETIALGIVAAAKDGDARAAKELREATEGRLPDRVFIEGHQTVEHVLSDASEEELDAIIDNYRTIDAQPRGQAASCRGYLGEGTSSQAEA